MTLKDNIKFSIDIFLDQLIEIMKKNEYETISIDQLIEMKHHLKVKL